MKKDLGLVKNNKMVKKVEMIWEHQTKHKQLPHITFIPDDYPIELFIETIQHQMGISLYHVITDEGIWGKENGKLIKLSSN